MNHRLFIKIYLTVLASVALAAFIIAVVSVATQFHPRETVLERASRFLQVMLPPGQSDDQVKKQIETLGAALDAQIVVFAPDGRLIAFALGANKPPLPPLAELRRLQRAKDRRRENLISVELPDGRQVISSLYVPGPPKGLRGPFTFIGIIALAIGLAAYPVVRQLTRRLENLRQAVEFWGDGHLSSRAKVEGRDEVATVARSFNRAAEQVEALIAGHRSLLANASHELRSPLARLRMALELYEAAPSEAIREEFIRNLAELDSLVEEILLASRLDSVTDLEKTESVDFLAITAEEANAEGVEIDGVAANLRGDSRLLRRLVRNLIQNAKRHGAPPVSVTVECPTPDHVRLTVSDCGQGLPEGEYQRVFEPFYRPAGRSEAAGGWGLGLSLVRQIASHHHGSVTYQPSATGGASFVVLLPREAQ